MRTVKPSTTTSCIATTLIFPFHGQWWQARLCHLLTVYLGLQLPWLQKACFDASSALPAQTANLGRSASDVHKLPQPEKCCAWQFKKSMWRTFVNIDFCFINHALFTIDSYKLFLPINFLNFLLWIRQKKNPIFRNARKQLLQWQ